MYFEELYRATSAYVTTMRNKAYIFVSAVNYSSAANHNIAIPM